MATDAKAQALEPLRTPGWRSLLRWPPWEPTERSLWALVGIGGVGLASAALDSLDDAAPIFFGGLAVGMALDWLLAGSPADVDVRRRFPLRWHQGEETPITYVVGQSGKASAGARVHLADTLPDGAFEVGADLDAASEPENSRSPLVERALSIDEHEEVTFTARGIHFERGVWAFGRIAIRTEGPLRLVRRRERRVAQGGINVLPNLSRIGARAQRLLRGQDAEGARRRRLRQEGRDFESLREYVRGDDLRLIAWKASARAGQLIVKRMQPETRQDIVVLLDTGRHMLGRHAIDDGGEPRVDVALASALTLTAAALLRGDRVGFVAFADGVRAWVNPEQGHGHLRRIGDAVGGVQSLPEEADYGEVVRFLIARLKRRAMVAVITDVVDEPSARALAAAVTQLRGRHLPVVIALGDPGTARLARNPAGPSAHEGRSERIEQKAVRRAADRLLDHRRRGLAAVAAAGATVIDAPAPRAASLSVQAYNTVKSQGRL